MKKEKFMKTQKHVQILGIFVILFLFVLASCDSTAKDDDTSAATAPPAAKTITFDAVTATGFTVKWVNGTLVAKTHLSKAKVALKQTEVNYTVYYVEKKGTATRKVADVKKDAKTSKNAKALFEKAITGLTAGKTYEVVVEAVNTTDTTKTALSSKPPSSQKTEETVVADQATDPGVPGSFAANVATAASVTLTWTIPITGVKKDDGTDAAEANIYHTVYYVAQVAGATKTAAAIKTAATATTTKPVGVGLKTLTFALTAGEYEFVIEAINDTDNTKTKLSAALLGTVI